MTFFPIDHIQSRLIPTRIWWPEFSENTSQSTAQKIMKKAKIRHWESWWTGVQIPLRYFFYKNGIICGVFWLSYFKMVNTIKKVTCCTTHKTHSQSAAAEWLLSLLSQNLPAPLGSLIPDFSPFFIIFWTVDFDVITENSCHQILIRMCFMSCAACHLLYSVHHFRIGVSEYNTDNSIFLEKVPKRDSNPVPLGCLIRNFSFFHYF